MRNTLVVETREKIEVESVSSSLGISALWMEEFANKGIHEQPNTPPVLH